MNGKNNLKTIHNHLSNFEINCVIFISLWLMTEAKFDCSWFQDDYRSLSFGTFWLIHEWSWKINHDTWQFVAIGKLYFAFVSHIELFGHAEKHTDSSNSDSFLFVYLIIKELVFFVTGVGYSKRITKMVFFYN